MEGRRGRARRIRPRVVCEGEREGGSTSSWRSRRRRRSAVHSFSGRKMKVEDEQTRELLFSQRRGEGTRRERG